MGIRESRTTNIATTLTTGREFGRRKFLKIQIGRVSTVPLVKLVTTISSNDRAKASKPPATRAVERLGSRTYRNVCHPSAPRSIDASTSEPGVLRRRAITLL